MTTSTPPARPPAEASTPTALVPLNLIRTDTVLARFPIHNLAKKGEMHSHITVTNAQGQVDCSWQVFPNPAFGAPRQLAYKLDTLVINKKLDALGRPLPRLIRLGSLRQISQQLGLSTGKVVKDLHNAGHQNAGVYIIAKLHYTATDGTTRTLEAGFTRYSIIFTGERLPDGTKADAIYLLLNEPYWDVLNRAPDTASGLRLPPSPPAHGSALLRNHQRKALHRAQVWAPTCQAPVLGVLYFRRAATLHRLRPRQKADVQSA